MFYEIMYLALGFVLLVKGADFFVEGSSSVAKILRVPSIIIGLTIVAFGTSAPEAAVSITAALRGANEIAVGNVIGSNIFNLLCVIGICGMIKAMPIDKKILKKDYAFSIVVTVVLIIMMAADMQVGALDGIILLLFFAYYMWRMISSALSDRTEAEDDIKLLSPGMSAVYIVAGLAGIIAGGNFVVAGASGIAVRFGLSETLIGLTIVAIGTSLPELVTSLVASRKGENGLALGNVVGSNIFNIIFILGMSSAIRPISIQMNSVYDAVFLIFVTLITWWLAGNDWKISKKEGAVMVALYAAYTAYIIMR